MKCRTFNSAFIVGALFMLAVVPVFSQGKKGGGNKEKIQYKFYVVFDGDFTLLEENNGGAPWVLISGTGGHGNIGVSPTLNLEEERVTVPLDNVIIAAIGDAYTPDCGYESPTCSERLDPEANTIHDAEWLGFKYDETADWFDVELNFAFSVTEGDPGGGSYGYSVQAYGDILALATATWNPADEAFCAKIDFHSVRMWQNSPTIRQRNKQCAETTFFATCEADVTLLNAPFQAVIWRDGSLCEP